MTPAPPQAAAVRGPFRIDYIHASVLPEPTDPRSLPIDVAILAASDTRSRGTTNDEATPLLANRLRLAGFNVAECRIVPDELNEIASEIRALADDHRSPLILTTGGTGLGTRDVTPEATQSVVDRIVPGLQEAVRFSTAQRVPFAWLSRGIAGLRGRTLVINLPGKPSAAIECLEVLLPLLPHALEMIRDNPHPVNDSAAPEGRRST